MRIKSRTEVISSHAAWLEKNDRARRTSARDPRFAPLIEMSDNEIREKIQDMEALNSADKVEAERGPGNDADISPADMYETLKSLGLSVSREDVEDMVWEIDENLDGRVNWGEFKKMYQHNLKYSDSSSVVPQGFVLFNAVQFMMIDKDFSGSITIEEATDVLKSRHSSQNAEEQLRALIDAALCRGGNANEISLKLYMEVVGSHPSQKVKIPSALSSSISRRMKAD